MKVKICTKCRLEKLVDEFPKDPRRKMGVGSSCKLCNRKHYHANKEEILNQQKKYYDTNKEKKLKTTKSLYYQKRDEILRQKSEYSKNPDVKQKKREQARRYVKELQDCYVRKTLKDKMPSIDITEFTPQMIETQRLIISLKREIK